MICVTLLRLSSLSTHSQSELQCTHVKKVKTAAEDAALADEYVEYVWTHRISGVKS